MKIRLSLFCIAAALCAFNVADAQQEHSFGDGAYAQSAVQQVSGDLLHQPGFPGRLWFEANLSDDGLGYNGSYLTVGGKTRLFEDRLDGRWVVEGQSHFSLEEEGGFFANIGIERVFSIPAAESDVTLGFWYDYNGDRQSTFSHEFHQVAASASIKTRKFDLIGNGYFPIGEANYTYGDLSGADCFVGNDIVMVPGIDSALKGFDVALRFRPKQFAFANGTIDIGGYQYSSDIIDAFAGGKVRFGMQFQQGMIVNLEVNHDDRFDTTGVLGFGWLFGANASGHGHEYSQQGRDLEQTVRNDHVVVFNQAVVLATDPDSGSPYNVIHVDNTADATVEDGTAENPFSELLLAEGASAPSDVILVHGGDGTDFNMDQGVTLQDNQRLWGYGDPLLIPIAGGEFFELCTDPAGTPTISNSGGSTVVTMADNNDVAGINIDASGATFGITSSGDSGSIRGNTVSNATLDGVFLSSVSGDWTISDNTFATNGRNGLFVLNALDTTSNILIDGNTATGNGQDGIMFMNYDPATISFVDNVTSNNVRHGVYLENYLNSTGGDLMFLRHVADGNAGTGVFANIGRGDLMLLNSSLTNNAGAGFRVRNWATVDPDAVLIGITEGGVSDISSNGALANVEILLDDPGIHTRVAVTGQTLNTGVRGLAARVEGATAGGVRSTLDIDIIDNVSINGNLNDGISLAAIDGALIRANIGNSEGEVPLAILDNAAGTGDGISLLADGADPLVATDPPAEIVAVIDNVAISNQISQIPGTPPITIRTDGIGIVGVGHSVVDVTVSDSTIGTPANGFGRITQNGVRINLDNNGSELINKIMLDNITVFADIDVSLITAPETYTDFVLQNSTLLPAGIQSVGGNADNTPFTDGIGSIGLLVVTEGAAIPTGADNMIYPNSELVSFVELASDGVLDNLTRVEVTGNTFSDFTLEGVDINTTGDAQMLLTMNGNTVRNNGAGFNNDTDNDNVFNEQGVDGTGVGDPSNLFFFDGVDINAFDDSQISTRIVGNTFLDNFERGLSLNTFNRATINALVDSNVFARNDRGLDVDLTNPPIGVGTAAGFTGAISTAGFADFEAINNEEFYFRNYESLIFINGATGVPNTLGGMALPANSFGVFYPGNAGIDIFGFPVALGIAEMNLAMSSNSFQAGVDLQDFAVAPGDFTLGLDGLTNGFTGPFFGITDAVYPAPQGLIGIQETFFGGEGF